MTGPSLHNSHPVGRLSVNSASNAGTNFRNVNNNGNVNNNNNATNQGGVAPGSHESQGIIVASNPLCDESRHESFVEGEPVLSAQSAKQDLVASDLSTSALMKCQRRCARGLRWKRPVQEMLLRPVSRAAKLRRAVEERTYRPHKLDPILIDERGKTRQVRPQTITDRVIQTWLTVNFLTPLATERMIPDSYACIKGRGLDYALSRVKSMIARAPMDAWVGQFDFKGYFASIEHEKLLDTLMDYAPTDLIRWLTHTIFSNNLVESRGVGLELGACTSQIGATMFPDHVDRAALATPGCLGYGRYMDDGIFLADSKASACAIMDAVRHASHDLGLAINEKKTHINRIAHPIVFCKHRFEKTPEGVKGYVRSPQIYRIRRHIRNVNRLSSTLRKPIDTTPIRSSYHGYLNRGDADLLYLLDDIK